MLSNNLTSVPDRAQALDTVLDLAAYPQGSLSQLSTLRLWLVLTHSGEYDAERATSIPVQGSRNGRLVEPEEITNPLLDNNSLPAMPIATVSTSCNSASEASKYGVLINIYVTRKATNPPCSQFNPVNCSSVSDEVSAHAEWTTGSRPNEEATLTPTNPTLGYRTLSAFTLYGELSVACTPEDFASVCARLQQEWSFDAGFLIAIAAVNATILAIAPGSIFKIGSYAHSAIATSSAACGIGITCDVWFLLRYNWVDLKTFICRSRDLYDSYVSFSLSSRMPTFCMLVSSSSLMAFLGLTAFDASPAGVLVIVVLVVLAMTIQFVVYGAHRFTTSVLHIWRAGALSMVNVVERLRGFAV